MTNEDLFRKSLVEHLKRGFITVDIDRFNNGEWFAVDECGCESALRDTKNEALEGLVDKLSDVIKNPRYKLVFENGKRAIGVIYESDE